MNAPGKDRFEIRTLDPERERERWDAFVEQSPQATPFATSAWLRLACEVADADHEILVASKGDAWIAGVPLVSRRRAGLRVHFGLPLAAYNTWLYRPPTGGSAARATSEHLEVTRQLLGALKGRMRNLSHMLVPSIVDARPWIWEGWSARPRYTYRLDLTTELDPSDSVRRHLRKCREAGFTMAWDWDLARFETVFEETRARQGFGLRLDRERFGRLADGLARAGLAWMATASTAAGEPAASQIVLAGPGRAGISMWVAGARTEHLPSGVSAWIMAEIAAEAARRGHASWDLCGADIPAVARFKGELGAKLEVYYQVDAPRGPLEKGWALVRGLTRR